jgi:TolB-like protein/DNA-binding winged helix-turn-helix (wHTH) protein
VQDAIYRFGDFELNQARFELCRNGRTVKLERIPMELLVLLLESDGKVVARQEIIERLWGKTVFVDTEHGINTAIRKIRMALREDAERPRFLLTVPGKGYRFIRETTNGSTRGTVSAEQIEVIEPTVPASQPASFHRPIALAAIIVAVLAATLLTLILRNKALSSPHIQSIAVLPLANLSGDPAQDYFADGMTDELITMLARNTSLRVISRTSVMEYKGTARPLRDIARELGADAILEGSVNRAASRVHMNLQLIYAPGDTHIWAESYDRDINDIYSLPSELSYSIAQKLKTDASPGKRQRYIKPEAHDAYLRGRFFWFAEDYPRSLDYMKRAIELQSDYAAAWSGLADNYAVLAVANVAAPREVMEKAQSAARRALELDDSLPEVHNSVAALHLFYDWDWNKADAELRRAVELNPDFAEAHHVRAYLMIALNRPEDALKEQRRSSELDPFARPFALGFVLTHLRQFDAAIDELLSRKKDLPQDSKVRSCLVDAYRYRGMQQESAREFEDAVLLQGDKEFAAQFRHAFEKGGDKAVAEWRIKRRSNPEVKKIYLSSLVLAHWYARAGEKQRALNALEDAYQEHVPFMVFLQSEPDFDILHSEPRYQALVQKMGLPPAY